MEEIAHRFDHALVRTFLPVLISKQAEDRLRTLGLISNTHTSHKRRGRAAEGWS